MPMLLAVIALFAAGSLLQWVFPLGQAGAYHDFADARTWLGLPNAANVLSNLPIFLAGVATLAWVFGHRGGAGGRLRAGLLMAGIGLAMTGIGSAYYHYAPNDATLVWDRLPLAVVFAGVLLMAWSCAAAVPPRPHEVALLVIASLGSVAFWVYLGSLWPYAILQYGGLAALLWLALRGRLAGLAGWWCVIALYALAKVFEILDRAVWDWSGQLISGHTLKHLMSAAAGFAFLWIAATAEREGAKGPAPIIRQPLA